MPLGSEKLTPAQRRDYLAKTESKKAGEVTLAIAYLRDWAKRNVDDDATLDIVRAFDRCAGDKRTTVATSANNALNTLMWAARHAGELDTLWKLASKAKLARAATALAPPEHQDSTTPEGTAERLLARKQGKQLRAEIAAAKPQQARELVGKIHGESGQADVDVATVALAVTDAVAHRDDVTRLAAIDAVAIAAGRAE